MLLFRDAKIAALERTSQESEKMIAEARNERLKHMDEIHLANKKFTEMESKLKDMESKLAEKDAMIKVLQKHSEDRDAALHKSMIRHCRSASTMGLVASNNSKSSLHPPIIGGGGGGSGNPSDSLQNELNKLSISTCNTSRPQPPPSSSSNSSQQLVVTDDGQQVDQQLKDVQLSNTVGLELCSFNSC